MHSTDLAISFFTFLTVLANLATVTIVGLALAARWRSPSLQRSWSVARAELVEGGLALAWLVAAVSTAGSLWFSEVAGFQPCRLCWIQRACMYPLTLVLAVAAWSRHRAAARSSDRASSLDSADDGDGGIRVASVALVARLLALALAAIGATVAIYHVLIERFPSLETGACDPTMPCTVVWFERLGFVTLPYMALSGFALIVTLLAASGLVRREEEHRRSTPTPAHSDHRSSTPSATSNPTPTPTPTPEEVHR